MMAARSASSLVPAPARPGPWSAGWLACSRTGHLPSGYLLVTFSRRAASELIRRTCQLVDPRIAKRVEAGTFHSVAHRILRRYSSSLGLPEGFTVMDQGDVVDLFALLRTPIAADRHRRFPKASTVAAVYARVISSQVSVEETVARDFPWCAEDIDGLKSIFTGLYRTEAGPAVAGLRRPSALLASCGQGSERRPCPCFDVRPRAGRRVPGHQHRSSRCPSGTPLVGRAGSPSSGTMLRRSTRFGRPRSATFWTFLNTSPAPPPSRWSTTTGPPDPSSNWPMP